MSCDYCKKGKKLPCLACGAPTPWGSACSDLLCDFPSPSENARKQLAEGMLVEKERLIKAAISHKLGRSNWTLADVKGRGEFIITPDKIETFCFDGMELIDFYPAKFGVVENVISGKQNYLLLYT